MPGEIHFISEMPRKPRFAPPNYALHITQRGNYRQKIFFTDEDRTQFLALLDHHADLRQVIVHGHVLMSNHFHLVVTGLMEGGVATASSALTANNVKYIPSYASSEWTGDLEALASELVGKHNALRTALDAADVAREQAERASQVKSLFLGMVSHELRTPIATMDMNVQMLERSRETSLPEYHRRRIERLGRATRQIAALVESLLEYARIESGRVNVHLEELDAVAIVREVLATHADHVADGVALQFDAPAMPLPVLVSDARLVRVVLSNLVSNALKFTVRGSVRLTLAFEAAWHVFEVHDTGPGLEDADIARIFLPFEQLTPLQRKSTPGVGLGLALVDQIVTALGGMVEIASRPGEGSVFTVRLPVIPPGTAGQISSLE